MEGNQVGSHAETIDFVMAGLAFGTSEPAAEVVRCLNCGVRSRCIGSVAAQAGTLQLKDLLAGRRVLRAGEELYRAGEPFRHVYAVRSGALKSLAAVDGDLAVLGFHLPGELVGGDGLAGGRHRATVRALQETELCAVRLGHAGPRAGGRPFFERLWDMLSCELLRERTHRGLLATLAPPERASAFLASFDSRMRARGCAPEDFQLPRWQADIASYLGVPVETVAAALQGRSSGGDQLPPPPRRR